MQLADLLRRLSREERDTIFERRLVPEHLRDNPQALSASLTYPQSLALAYTEINAAQAKVLQWLSERPDLQATWLELREALGDRVSSDLLRSYLTDLRELALLDFDEKERGGFIATYPAAISIFPTERRKPLQEWLAPLSADTLTRMCKALGVVSANRKDDRVRAISQALLDALMRQSILMQKVSPDAARLFLWIAERDGLVSAHEMAQRVRRPALSGYGRYAWTHETVWDTPKGPLDPLTELMRHGLVFPVVLSPGGYYAPTAFAIPQDVRSQLDGDSYFAHTAFTPPPLEPATVAGGSVPSPGNLLRDLGHLLGFVETGRCEWRQDGQPYKRSLTTFGKLIGTRDQDYVELLWALLVGARLVEISRGAGPDYAVRFIARAAGDYSPKELFGQIVLSWVNAGGIALHRGGAVYFQDNVRLRMLMFLRIVVPDVWITRPSVDAWLRFTWPLIFDPAAFGIGGVTPETSLKSAGALVLAHGQTADGRAAIMLPARHQQLLDLQKTGADGLPPWAEEWTVQPDRSIIAPPNLHLDAIVDLWRVAALESNQGAPVFRVSAASIAAALNRGMEPEQIRDVLATRSRVPLPPTVERLIDDQSQRYGRIKVGRAETFVQVDDPALLDELRRSAKLKKLRWHDVAPGVAFVLSDQPDAVIDTLRKAGYLPVRAEEKAATKGRKAAVSTLSATAIRRTVNEAVDQGLGLEVTWTARGRMQRDVLDPLDLHGSTLHALRSDGYSEVEVPFSQIVEIAAVTSTGVDLYADFDGMP